MKITKVAGRLKGIEFVHDLGHVNVVVGPNASGKSAVLEAVRLALLGYSPRLGKTGQGIFRLAHGTRLYAAAELEDGRLIERAWKLERGSVKRDGSEDAVVAPMLLDMTSYFELSKQARLDHIFGLVAPEKIALTPEALRAAVKAVKVEEPTEATEAALTEVCEIIDELSVSAEAEGVTPQEWLGKIIETVQALAKERGDQAKAMGATAATTAQMQAEAGLQADPVDLEKRLATIQAARDALVTQRERIAQQLQAAAEFKKRREALALKASGAVDFTAAIEAGRKRVAELEAVTADQGTEEDAALRSEAEELAQRIIAHESGTVAATEVERKARDKWLLAGSALKKAEQESARLKAERASLLACPACPTCGAAGEPFLKLVATKLDPQIGDSQVRLMNAEEEHDVALATAAEATTALKIEQEKDAEITTAADRLRGIQGKLLAIQSARTEASRKRQAAIDEARTALARVEAEQREHGEAKAALAGLGEPPACPAPEEAAQIESDLKAATQDAAAVEAQIKQTIARRQDDARQEEARQRRLKLEEEAGAVKAALKALIEKQKAVVADAIGSVLESTRQFTEGFTPDLEYRDGEIGWVRDGQWVSHHTFSGTEEAITFAALGVALAGGGEVRVVLMDEMGRMTGENKRKCVERMQELTAAGVIDTFIGADVVGEWVPVGVEVIKTV